MINMIAKNNEQIEAVKLTEIRKKLQYQKIIYAKKAIKINKNNKAQERIIIITYNNFYNFSKTIIKRTIKINTIEAISLSLTSNEIVLHIPSEYDYRYQSESRNEIIHKLVEARTQSLGANDLIKLFTHKEKFLDHVTTTEDDSKKSKSKIPKQQYKTINLLNLHTLICKEVYSIMNKQDEYLLYISSDHVNNYKLRIFQEQYIINRGTIQQYIIKKCTKTGQLFISKQFKKELLNIGIDSFRDILINYEKQSVSNTYVEKLQSAVQKDSVFILTFMYYPLGDLFAQLTSLGCLEENIIRRNFARMILAIQKIEEVFASIQLQNIVIDEKGNTFLCSFNRYLKCDFPLQYLTPQQLSNNKIQKPYLTNLWKLAIASYEMAYGIPPFTIGEICYVINNDIEFNLQFPQNPKKSPQFQQFLRRIFKKNLKQRIGYEQLLKQVKNTKWMRNISLDNIAESQIHPYFIALTKQQIYSEKLQKIQQLKL